MNLSPDMKRLLVKEMEFATQKMSAADNAAEKLYYFSAVFGAVSRVMNFEYDPHLGFIHQTLQLAYNQMNARVGALVGKQDVAVSLPPDLFQRLDEGVSQLIALLNRDAATYPALEYISNLAFSTTGTGYYLYLKGSLVLS